MATRVRTSAAELGRGSLATTLDQRALRADSTTMTPDPAANFSAERQPRLLGIFAHPDDETLGAGGTFAKYAEAGAEVHVVSLTRGGAGQIRDAGIATRSTLREVRERELDAAGKELGLTETRCLDHPDEIGRAHV